MPKPANVSTTAVKARRTRTKRTRDVAATPRQIEHMMMYALVQDVEELQRRFKECAGDSFAEFAEIFIEREFSTIFLGRYTITDLVEFSEMLIGYASSLMFTVPEGVYEVPFICGDKALETRKLNAPRRNRAVKERIFGIYLTYCLYFVQPAKHIANVQLSVKQMHELTQLCQVELIRDHCNEALFCLQRLVDEHAIFVVPFENEFNPTLARHYKNAEVVADYVDLTEPSSSTVLMPSLHNVENDYTLHQVEIIHNRYMGLKACTDLPEGLALVEESLLDAVANVIKRTEEALKPPDTK